MTNRGPRSKTDQLVTMYHTRGILLPASRTATGRDWLMRPKVNKTGKEGEGQAFAPHSTALSWSFSGLTPGFGPAAGRRPVLREMALVHVALSLSLSCTSASRLLADNGKPWLRW